MIDFQVSELFGGMEVCGLSIVVSKDGKEFILGASDSTLSLMGETQEDDRRHIADLVVTRMQVTASSKVSNFERNTYTFAISERLSSADGEINSSIIGFVSWQPNRRRWSASCSTDRQLLSRFIYQRPTTTNSGTNNTRTWFDWSTWKLEQRFFRFT